MNSFEADYIYQQNLQKAMKAVTKAQNNLAGVQYGVGTMRDGEYYDPQSGVIVKQVNQRITARVCETMIAQFLSNYRVPIAQIPQYIASTGLRFKAIDDISFSMQVDNHNYNVRHICDAGVSFGTYVEVPLITRDIINVNNMNVICEYRYDSTYAKLNMYLCELCGMVLYNYSE